MLSNTYVQVAMQLENDHLREEILALSGKVDDCCSKTGFQLEAARALLELMHHLHRQCVSRRLEIHFLPEMRKQVPECEELMMEHDALYQQNRDMYHSICRFLCIIEADDPLPVNQLKTQVKQYCQKMQYMLEMEEKVLFSLAQEKLSREDWFSLARIFMRDDSDERRTHVVVELGERDMENYCFLATSYPGKKMGSEVYYR